MRDPYKILGVKRDAGADEIKAAWRSLAKSVHPDHNQEDPNATERFTEIGRAYETLKDPKKRSRFDHLSQTAEAKRGGETIMQQRQAAREAAERAKAARANAEKVMEELARAKAQRAAEATAETAAAPETGSTAPKGAGKSGPTGANPSTGAGESAEAMIERIFGAKAGAASSASEPAAAAAAPGASAGSAASSASPASATSAAASAEKRQEAPKSEAATSEEVTDEQEQVLAAGGIGALVGRPPLAILSSLVRRLTGAAPALEKAPDIAAEASVTVDDILKGQWIAVTLSDGREVRFQAAPGIGDGQVVRLKGQGLKLQGMQRGDVAITVHLHEQGQFAIKGLDVHTVLPVTIENAVLGCTATVEGPNGPVTVTVPAWSGSDHLIRVAGGGLSGPGEASGDLVVELRLMLWEKPDDKVTDLMRSMKNGLYL